MAPRKGAGENSKKAAGQARKAEAAAQKQAAENSRRDAAETSEWQKGAKDNKKAEAAAAKAADAARKKAEKQALLAAEDASLPTGGGKNSKQAVKKNAKPAPRAAGTGLDAALSSLDGKKGQTLNASGIDDALDALNLTGNANEKIDRHPERRFKAAYTVFEEQRLEEMKDDKGLRRQQKIEIIRKEFDKHPDNPFNQASGKYNSTQTELNSIKQEERDKAESRLASPI